LNIEVCPINPATIRNQAGIGHFLMNFIKVITLLQMNSDAGLNMGNR